MPSVSKIIFFFDNRRNNKKRMVSHALIFSISAYSANSFSTAANLIQQQSSFIASFSSSMGGYEGAISDESRWGRCRKDM